MKRVCPQASVESSAKICAPSSLTAALPNTVDQVIERDSGGTPTLGWQLMSSYQTAVSSKIVRRNAGVDVV